MLLFHEVMFIVIIVSLLAALAALGCSLIVLMSTCVLRKLLYACFVTYVRWSWVRVSVAVGPCARNLGWRRACMFHGMLINRIIIMRAQWGLHCTPADH